MSAGHREVAFVFLNCRMIALETPLAAALNHLLDTEPWARERLAPFAGETVAFATPPLPELRVAILGDGRVAPAVHGAQPSLTVALKPDALAALARGEEHFMRSVEVIGNARLASEVLLLVRQLRWDAEEDLSKLVGDVAAHRIVGLARDFSAWQVDAVRRLADGVMDYALEERRILVRRAELDALAVQTAQLGDALERLEKRLERLS
jgi:ubiquinone biosynthesis protein UbiJ